MRQIRSAAAVAVVVFTVVLTASAAWAHVTVQGTARQGGFATVAFQVPNERPTAKTVKVAVQFPRDHPLAFVSVQEKPGWTAEVKKRTLDTPLEAEGEKVTEVVDTITWSGGDIGPGEFDDFRVSMGFLPTGVSALEFPTIQTYDNGEEVAWIQQQEAGQPEPERPAPTLTLLPAEKEGAEATAEGAGEAPSTTTKAQVAAAPVEATAVADAQQKADDASTLATVALVVGGVGLLAGIIGIVVGRRRPSDAS